MKYGFKTNRVLKLAVVCIFTLFCVWNLIACANVKGEGCMHTYIVDEVKAATCTETGLTAGAHCSACGEILLEQEAIPMIQHVPEEVDAVEPTLTQTGLTAGMNCKICGKVLIPQQVTEKRQYSEFGFAVTFITDDNISVGIFKSQNYSDSIEVSNVGYSRDGDSGQLLKNGDGQINFRLQFSDGYGVDDILITSGYKNLKLPSETGADNTYRITKITKDITVWITSRYVELERFASVVNDDGKVNFAWKSNGVERVDIDVIADEIADSYTVNNRDSWAYTMQSGVRYEFIFTPINKDGTIGKTERCLHYYNPDIKSLSFPKIEITTRDYVLPSCDYIAAPPDCMGRNITNNEYEQCLVNVLNADNQSVYTSSGDDFAAAKIKIRGNASAYQDKKSFKIKLNKKADLLKSFIPDRSAACADKEWVLLRGGASLNQVVGGEVSELLGLDYTPAFVYVMLYLNGDYRGLYILCESVKQGNISGGEQSRCQVNDDGFIVEADAYWWNENLYFSTPVMQSTPMRYSFKYPDPDDMSENSEELIYIKDYITEFEQALDDSSDLYKNYIDEETFAKWLLGHDIIGTSDAGGANIYLTKKDGTADSRLRMSLMWDFDSACDNLCIESFAIIREMDFFYFPQLLQRESFVQTYRSLFENVKASVVDGVTAKISQFDIDSYKALVEIDKGLWSDLDIEGFDEQKTRILSWFEEHMGWLDEQINYGD